MSQNSEESGEPTFVGVMRENLHRYVEDYIESYRDSWPTSQDATKLEQSDGSGRAEDFMHYLANNLIPVNREDGLVFWFNVQLKAARISDGREADPWTGEVKE